MDRRSPFRHGRILLKDFLVKGISVSGMKKAQKLAWANTLWTYVDLKTGHPTRVPKEEQEAYVLHEKLDMDYAPRKKLHFREKMEKKESFLIVKHHIDTNHHVNNGQYVQMAMEFLPDDFRISQMRAEYKKAALLGDMVVPYIHIEEKKLYRVAV